MNSRERLLLIVLIVILGGGGLLFGTVQWFIKPLRELSKQIDEMSDKRDEAHAQWNQYVQDRKKLQLARARSLPADVADATYEYMTVYLEPLLQASGLKERNITRTQATEFKFAPSIPGIKKSGHQMLAFSIRAKGDLGQLIFVLDRLAHTPYEHRVRSITIDRADLSPNSKDPNPKLTINMVIEALILNKAPDRQGMPPGFDPTFAVLDHFAARQGGIPLGWGVMGAVLAMQQTVPHPADRRYDEIQYQNIFAGKFPPKKEPPPVEPEEPYEPPVQPRINVPQYVRLVQTSPDLHEAYLRNIVYSRWSPGDKSQELRIVAVENSGAEHFKIIDQDTDYEFCRAKVLRVDTRAIYFQVGRRVYQWEIGTSLTDALENHMDLSRLDDLDLEPDMKYAAAEAVREKELAEKEEARKPTKKKTTTTKGTPKGQPKGQPKSTK